jgi:hypothetical protein
LSGDASDHRGFVCACIRHACIQLAVQKRYYTDAVFENGVVGQTLLT